MSGGTKYDQGKAPIHFLTRPFVEGVSKAQGFGADKYGDFNFCKGIKYNRLLDAAMRHLLAFTWGEDLDPESKINHIYHAAANLNMLAYMIENHPELDDRYKGEVTQTIQKVMEVHSPTLSKLNDECFGNVQLTAEDHAFLDAISETADEFGLDKEKFLKFNKEEK